MSTHAPEAHLLENAEEVDLNVERGLAELIKRVSRRQTFQNTATAAENPVTALLVSKQLALQRRLGEGTAVIDEGLLSASTAFMNRATRAPSGTGRG